MNGIIDIDSGARKNGCEPVFQVLDSCRHELSLPTTRTILEKQNKQTKSNCKVDLFERKADLDGGGVCKVRLFFFFFGKKKTL